MRMILDCEPDIAVLAMRAIKSAMKRPDNLVQIVGFEDGSIFLVRKTKTGWSAKADNTES